MASQVGDGQVSGVVDEVRPVDIEVQVLVDKGRKYTEYLLVSAKELKGLFGDGSHCQIKAEKLWLTLLDDWDARIEVGRTPKTLQTISHALSSIEVGAVVYRDRTILDPHKVDAAVFPNGPISLSRCGLPPAYHNSNKTSNRASNRAATRLSSTSPME
jgi:hypothetical protein